MLRDRGYFVSEQELEMTFDNFRQRYGDEPQKGSLTILAPRPDNPAEQIFIFFVDNEGKDKISNKVISK